MDPASIVPSSGDTPMSAVTARLGAEFGEGQFAAVPGAMVRCYTCHRDTPASDLSADEVTRLEGASDPADMVAVVPVGCPHCSAHGALTLHYGPEATVEEAEVLLAMHRVPTVGRGGEAPTPGMQPPKATD